METEKKGFVACVKCNKLVEFNACSTNQNEEQAKKFLSFFKANFVCQKCQQKKRNGV